MASFIGRNAGAATAKEPMTSLDLIQPDREKGTGTFCAKHPEGRSGKRCLSPFPLRWSHRLAWMLAAATWLLIMVGAVVTGYGAGMSVPDWPKTYDYWFYPLERWVWARDVFHGTWPSDARATGGPAGNRAGCRSLGEATGGNGCAGWSQSRCWG